MRRRLQVKTSFFEKVFLVTGLFLIISALLSFMLKRLTMNPDSEFFFLIFGISIFLRFYWSRRKWTLQTVCAIALLLVLLILCFTFFNQLLPGKWARFFNLRNWLLIVHPGNGNWIFIIHLYFYMAVISMLFGFLDHQKPVLLYISMMLAVILMVSSVFHVIISLSGIRLTGIDPVQFPLLTQVSFFVLSLGLIIQAAHAVLYPDRERSYIERLPANLIWLFIFTAAAAIILGYAYFKQYEKDYKNAAWHQLSVIAGLKLDQITDWRNRCVRNGSIFYRNPEYSGHVLTFLQVPDQKENDQTFLMTWMMKFVESHREYTGMCIYDMSMQRRLTAGLYETGIDSSLLEYFHEVQESDKIIFSDLYRNDRDGKINLNILIPVHDSRYGQGPMIAILSLSIDPEKSLFPYLQNWPAPGETGEILLIRREDDRVVFLNPLLFNKNAALSLAFPVNLPDFTAAMAVRGVKGHIEGIDYRGVPVFSTFREVPDSPWILMAQMDRQEVFSSLTTRFFLTAILVAVLILAEGLLFYLQWHRKTLYFYKEHYQAAIALRESEQKYKTISELMRQGVFCQRPDGSVFDVNTAATEILGLSREQIKQGSPILNRNVIHEDGSVYPRMEQPSIVALRTGKPVYDSVAGIFNLKTRQYVWLQINAIPQFIEGKESPDHVVVTLYDITLLKRAWQQIDRSLKEKTVLLKEIHHRVKNNFQIISSLINFHSRQLADEHMKSIFSSFQSRIQSMALVHELMYHNHDFSRMNMHQYIENLVNNLNVLYHLKHHRISVSVKCENVFLNLNQALPCGMIISELVSNAIKHAFPGNQKGSIKIKMERKLSWTRLSVSDNGAAFPGDRLPDQFTTLGLMIVRDLVRQMNGTLDLFRHDNFKVFQIEFKTEANGVAEDKLTF